MIRKLLAGTALVALMSAGATGVATAQDSTKPAVVNEQAAAATDEKLVPETPTLATAFIGRSVYSSEDPESETIGDVNDLIIDDSGAITAAVVGVGGFLGIGEKDVAVPFDELQVVERDGEIRLIYAATREQLEAAPAVDLAQYDPAARFSEQQAAMNTAQQPAADAPLAPAPAGTDMAAAPAADNAAPPAATEDLTAKPADEQMAATDQTTMEPGFISAEAGQIRASTLLGHEVYGPDDQSIGEVSDLVLEKEGGTRAALIDVGGFLGVGEKTVAISFGDLQFTQADAAAEPRITVALTQEQLEQLPTYEPVDTASEVTGQAADQMAAAPPAADTTAPAAPSGNMAATDELPAGGQSSRQHRSDDDRCARRPGRHDDRRAGSGGERSDGRPRLRQR
jgi:sporulation protein YlmC with PRC-barrel domain